MKVFENVELIDVGIERDLYIKCGANRCGH
jgi:hypothetical protein